MRFTTMSTEMIPRSEKYFPRRRLVAFAILIAILSSQPYAGSWNDGSRLATVQSLVDNHTWSIDHSIFVRTPGIETANACSAYPADDSLLHSQGTLDKLFIRGHYYSDKSPVSALPMAGGYKILQIITGLTAAGSPGLFCYLLTFLFSGSAYVISVLCIDAMAAAIELPCFPRLLLPYSFALATVALPYARHVNNHLPLLAVTCLVAVQCVRIANLGKNGRFSQNLAALGALAGIGYTIDLGVGPMLVLSLAVFLVLQTRSARVLLIFLAAAFPWFLLHHALNYMIGGTFKPVNAVAAYFQWPGSPFNAGNLTGGWAHKSLWHFVVYTLGMMFGKKGFIGHNLPIYLSIPAIAFLLRNKDKDTPMVCFAVTLICGTWFLYGATSNNDSGMCCSVRWFVPLLAPFYFLLGLFLKKRPDYTSDLLILTGWGIVMGILMWIKGPWMQHMVPGFWPLQAAALSSWLAYRLRQPKVPLLLDCR
jgi:hypothetical protein